MLNLTGRPAVMVKAPFDTAITEICRKRPEVVVLSADLALYTDLFTVPRELPGQFVQVGVAEQNLMGVAGGLAKSGCIPVATTFAVYAVRRAYDHMVISMGTGPSRGVVVGFLPGILNPLRVHHQTLEDVAKLRSVPGACIIDPMDATELIDAVHASIDHPSLVYIRAERGMVPKLLNRGETAFAIGRVYPLRSEGDGGVGILSSGVATRWALEASVILQSRDIAHSILHVPSLKPCDTAAIAQFCAGRRLAITVENHSIIGGLGSLVAETLAGSSRHAPLVRMGIPDAWAPGGSVDHIRRQLSLDAESIARNIMELL
jgi:transketolase